MFGHRAFDPIEAGRAEQDKVYQQRQHKQEDEEADEDSTWIK
jgi:hypothetical protein